MGSAGPSGVTLIVYDGTCRSPATHVGVIKLRDGVAPASDTMGPAEYRSRPLERGAGRHPSNREPHSSLRLSILTTMRSFSSILLVALFAFSNVVSAQTTGVVGVNDLTINTLGTTTTSCNPLGLVLTQPGALTFDLSCPPGTIGIVAIGVGCAGGCGGISFFPSAPCAGGPACAGTNLWWSIGIPILTFVVPSNAAGIAQLVIPMVNVNPGCASAQGANFDPCSTAGILFSQAHTFCWN